MATSEIERSAKTLPETERPRVGLLTIFLTYLQIGAVAFGFAILQKLKAVVIEKRWMSEEEMNEGLALVQLYPGPIMVDFTAYVGYKLRGVAGALAATLGFILPSFFLMLALSAAYVALGRFAWIHPLFLPRGAQRDGTHQELCLRTSFVVLPLSKDRGLSDLLSEKSESVEQVSRDA